MPTSATTKQKAEMTMSKTKDKAIDAMNEQHQAAVPVGSPTGNLADLLKDIDGVTVSDDKRLRVTAADKDELAKLMATVRTSLADYDLTVSPTYRDAAAIGCVWNDIIATPKK